MMMRGERYVKKQEIELREGMRDLEFIGFYILQISGISRVVKS
jgi:hypothetical protein